MLKILATKTRQGEERIIRINEVSSLQIQETHTKSGVFRHISNEQVDTGIKSIISLVTAQKKKKRRNT